MKVLHAISSAGMYGAEAVVLALCRAMNREMPGSAALVVFQNTAQPNLALYEAAKAAGVESYLVTARGRIDRSTPGALRMLARSIGADVLHTHGYKADVYGYAAARSTGLRMVSTCHLWADADLVSRMYGWLNRLVLRRFHAIAAVSSAIEQRLLRSGVPAERVRVIRNGIDVSPYQRGERSERATLTVGFAARLSPEKGVDLFIETARLVLRQEPETRFLMAGEGPERANAERLIQKLGLADRILLLGRREDMAEVYRKYDVLLLSSRNEGLPIALIEAMASGLPVIATTVGDIPTLIGDNTTGLLVQSEDVHAMAAATLRLLRSSPLRQELGRAAAEKVLRDFSDKQMMQAYLDLYAHVLRDAGASA